LLLAFAVVDVFGVAELLAYVAPVPGAVLLAELVEDVELVWSFAGNVLDVEVWVVEFGSKLWLFAPKVDVLP